MVCLYARQNGPERSVGPTIVKHRSEKLSQNTTGKIYFLQRKILAIYLHSVHKVPATSLHPAVRSSDLGQLNLSIEAKP